jgi:hypothetical protein
MQGTPNNTRWLESGLEALRDVGLDWPEKMSSVLMVSGIVQVYAIFDADIDTWCRHTNSSPEAMMVRWSHVIGTVADPHQFRNVRAAMIAMASDQQPGDDDPDDVFRFALDRALDGIAALID